MNRATIHIDKKLSSRLKIEAIMQELTIQTLTENIINEYFAGRKIKAPRLVRKPVKNSSKSGNVGRNTPLK